MPLEFLARRYGDVLSTGHLREMRIEYIIIAKKLE